MPRKIIALLLCLLYGYSLLIYWFNLGFENIVLRESVYLSTSFLATVAGLIALWKFGLATARSRTFLFLTVGMGYWFLAEVLFDYYEYLAHVDPYPSAADIFYILGYIFMLVGLVNEIYIAKINWQKFQKPLWFLYGLVSISFVLLVTYFGIYKAYDPTKSFLVNSIGISYGIGDLLLILANIFVLILVWIFRGGKFSRFWIYLFLSFLCMLVADILFAIYADQYNEQVWLYKSLLDSFWMGAYLLFTYAFIDLVMTLANLYKTISTRRTLP